MSRRPLKLVRFRIPIEIDGFATRVKVIEPGKASYENDGTPLPQPFFDAELHCIIIGDSHYPLDGGLVERFVYAPAAKTVAPPAKAKASASKADSEK